MWAYVALLTGAAFTAFWGSMHLVKTGPALAGFEPLSADNRHVLRMEWIVEGVALLFVSALIVAVTWRIGPSEASAILVYRISAFFLLVLAAVSASTGARASPLPYKLCAPIFTAAALLILIGSALV